MPSRLTWTGSSSTAPLTPAGVVTVATTNPARNASSQLTRASLAAPPLVYAGRITHLPPAGRSSVPSGGLAINGIARRAARTARPSVLDQQCGAERAAQVAERRESHVGRVLVDEQVRVHGLADLLDVRLAQPGAQPAADHDRLDVEKVDRRGNACSERLDGT